MSLRILKAALVLGAATVLSGCVSYPRQQPVTSPAIVGVAPVAPAPIGVAPAQPFPTSPPPGAIVVPAPPPGAPCPNCPPPPPAPRPIP